MSSNLGLEKILEPGYIGKLKTRNRMIKSAAGMTWANNGQITARHKAFYEAIARGGVGLLIVESTACDYPLGASEQGQLRLDDDKFIPGYSEVNQIVHKYGCPIFLQFEHAGPLHLSQISGLQPVAASVLDKSEKPPEPENPYWENLTVRALTTAEVEELVEKITKAAERAVKAGFDGVEINFAGGHLGNTFISPIWNKRQDKYGCQNIENRARFLVETVQAIKKRLGKDFPVSVLYNICEIGFPNGTTIEDGQKIAQFLQAAGADLIHARPYGYAKYAMQGWPEQLYNPEPVDPLPSGYDFSHHGAGAMVPMAAKIKQAVSIPVMAVGRLDPKLGNQFIKEGKIDFVAMTRRLLADPELPNKVAAGRFEDVAPCTACMSCSYNPISPNPHHPITCRIDAALGGTDDYQIKPAPKKKKVVVVGGGPGGMEAARVAALRGHQVTLYEKEPKMGGLLPLAALVKGTEIEDIPALIKYLETQVKKLGVDLKLGKEFTPSLLEGNKPDVLILATGATAAIPDIPGIDNKIVVSGASLHARLKSLLRQFSPESLRSLTRLWIPVGKRVTIIGGAIQGVELADFLVKRGRKVTIVETAENIGEGLTGVNFMVLPPWLISKGVVLISGIKKYEEVTDKGLVITTKEGKKQLIEADSIATATSMKPNNEMLQELKGKAGEVYAIGDCHNPGLIIDAIAEGYRTARAI